MHGCGHSKCGPEFPKDPVPLAGTDCHDKQDAAALDRLQHLLNPRYPGREFANDAVFRDKPGGWEVLVDRAEYADARALALSDPLVRPYVYRDR